MSQESIGSVRGTSRTHDQAITRWKDTALYAHLLFWFRLIGSSLHKCLDNASKEQHGYFDWLSEWVSVSRGIMLHTLGQGVACIFFCCWLFAVVFCFALRCVCAPFGSIFFGQDESWRAPHCTDCTAHCRPPPPETWHLALERKQSIWMECMGEMEGQSKCCTQRALVNLFHSKAPTS